MTDYVETRCAVCQLSDGLIINIIMASPSEPAQDGCQLVEVMNEQPCDIGWLFDGFGFVPPVVVVDEPVIEEVVSSGD